MDNLNIATSVYAGLQVLQAVLDLVKVNGNLTDEEVETMYKTMYADLNAAVAAWKSVKA